MSWWYTKFPFCVFFVKMNSLENSDVNIEFVQICPRAVTAEYDPNNIHTFLCFVLLYLYNALVEVWQDVDLGTIRRFIRSMTRHCRACIQARGGHTRYWCVLSMWLSEWSQFWDKSVSWLSLCFSTWFRESLGKWLFPIRLGQFCWVLLQID